jgi:hypothetical protein
MKRAVFWPDEDRRAAQRIGGRAAFRRFRERKIKRGKRKKKNDISVLFPDKSGTRDFAHEQNTKAPEGAATGAGVGGVVGARSAG